MATAMRVRRRRKRTTTTANPDNYRRTRATIAVVAFIVAFSCLWLINGDMTAMFLHSQAGWSIEHGWVLHLALTAIELAPLFIVPYLPDQYRWILFPITALSLPFATFDVLTSAVGVSSYTAFTGLTGIHADALNTLAGLIIAFTPERMLVPLWAALAAIVRSKP